MTWATNAVDTVEASYRFTLRMEVPEIGMAAENAPSERATTRQDQILAAALRVFLKFGYDRTGMAEIAGAAALSRAALYHYFKGKEEVVLALIDQINGHALAKADAAAASSLPFERKLLDVLDAGLAQKYAILHDSPHRAELSDITHRITGEAVLAADQRFLALVEGVIENAAAGGEIDLGRTGLSPRSAADLCVFSAKGLMQGLNAAPQPADYRNRLQDLVRVTASGLASSKQH